MKIVLYFSTVFGIFWLIRGTLSHNDLGAERNTVQHSNAREDTESEHVFSESANLQDEVLIKSESPIRGRKIHQTAWSKEENDGEKSQVSKPSEQKNPELDNSWTLEKLLKYVMSFVYETEETDQQSQDWITAEDIQDKLEQKVSSKNKQKTYTTTEKNEDRISEKTQKNGKGSLMFKKGYLDRYQTFNKVPIEGEKSYENSYEYEESGFGEQRVDGNQTDYKTNIKKLQSIRTKHTFQNKGYEKNSRTFTKPDQGSSVQDDESTESKDCFEDIDDDQSSQEIQDEKTTLEKIISESNDMEQSSEELIYKNKQETVLNEKHFVNKGKNIFRSTTEKDGHHTSKESHEIIATNRTQYTGENVKTDGPETSITSKSKAELSDFENEMKEKTSKEIFISEHQEIQLDSYTHQERAQYKSNSSQTTTKAEIVNSVQNNSDDVDENIKSSSATKPKPSKTQQGSKNSLSETKQMASKYNETHKNEDIQTIHGQNEALVTTSSIDTTTKSQDEDNVTVQKIYPEILVIDDTRHEKIQAIYNEETINNPVDLVTTSSIDSTTKSQDLNEDTATVLGIHPEILVIDDARHEKIQAIYNEETMNNPVDLVTTSSIDSTTKSQDLNEDTATVLGIHPEILVIDDARHEKIQAIYNEETINNPVDLVTTSSIDSTTKSQDLNEDTATVLGIHPEILVIDDARHEKIQAIYNEETINNPVDLVTTSSFNSTTKSQDLKDDTATVLEIHPEILAIDEARQEKIQTVYNEETIINPVDLVTTSSIDSTTKSQDLNEDTATVLGIHPEILVIDDARHEKIQAIYNEETINNPVDLVTTSSFNSTTKSQDLKDDTATVLEIHPEILAIDEARQEKIQTVYNEETIINPVDLVTTSSIDSTTKSQDLKDDTATVLEIHPEILAIDEARQEKIQTVYNEETIINPAEIKHILKNGIDMQNGENKEFNVQKIPNFEILEKHLVEENQKERTENFEGMSQHQTSQSNSRISMAENNRQNYEHLNTNLDDQVNEKPLIFKFNEDDNAHEYILEGNEFIQLNDYNEPHKGLNYAFNKYESQNRSQILTDSIVTMLENVQHADDEQQETFDTILEFLYKRSNNPLILSLKENLSNYTF